VWGAVGSGASAWRRCQWPWPCCHCHWRWGALQPRVEPEAPSALEGWERTDGLLPCPCPQVATEELSYVA
jgi:hypothetical protein